MSSTVQVDTSVDGVGPVVGPMDIDPGGDGDVIIALISTVVLALVLGALTIIDSKCSVPSFLCPHYY